MQDTLLMHLVRMNHEIIPRQPAADRNVGSGFDDKSRDFIWQNREELIGRIAEVKYKEISKDKKTGLESLQFPVFVQIREKGKENL